MQHILDKEVVNRWYAREDVVDRHKERGGEVFTDEKGRELIVERKAPKYGGKYLITFEHNQDSQVRFNLKTCGIGDTLEQAYADYISKEKD